MSQKYNSEIYNNFITILENNKQKKEKLAINSAIPAFEAIEDYINSNPKLREAFSLLQTKFATDLSYRNKFDNNFAEGVMLLHLYDKEDKNDC